MFTRIFYSVLACLFYAGAIAIYSPYATLITGQVAGQQLRPSDGAYLHTIYTFSFFHGINIALTAIVLVILAAIWIPYIVRKSRNIEWVILALVLAPFLLVDRAHAYYDQKDFTEAYSIGPNETAIIVPDVGDNASTQVQMDSESYLKSKQVPHKRVIIPHQKLSGTGSFFDFYVPSARLFIVDRTTYSHEWVGRGRGTNANVDESIPCQSKEGLDITLGISIGTRVKEEDAARFLYNFGTEPLDPKSNRNDPQVIFRSVFYSRKVADVMNDIGRKAVQTFACEEATQRTLDDANAHAHEIMENVRKKSIEYFASVGITVQFIGWADTFHFSPAVQKAIDDNYIATTLQPKLAVLNAIADLKIQEGLGSGLDKHGLPMVITPDILNAIKGLAPKTVVPPPSPKAAAPAQ